MLASSSRAGENKLMFSWFGKVLAYHTERVDDLVSLEKMLGGGVSGEMPSLLGSLEEEVNSMSRFFLS